MTVLLFARARDLIGNDTVDLLGPAPANVAELRRRLREQQPRLADILEHSAIAINGEFAQDDTTIPACAEVALLPPVSGG